MTRSPPPGKARPPPTRAALPHPACPRPAQAAEQLRAKMSRLLGRSLRIDDATAVRGVPLLPLRGPQPRVRGPRGHRPALHLKTPHPTPHPPPPTPHPPPPTPHPHPPTPHPPPTPPTPTPTPPPTPPTPHPHPTPHPPPPQLYYIEEAGGDVKAAMSAAEADAAWADATPGPIRTAPVSRWIRGEAGL
jgi:hypothetical protein